MPMQGGPRGARLGPLFLMNCDLHTESLLFSGRGIKVEKTIGTISDIRARAKVVLGQAPRSGPETYFHPVPFTWDIREERITVLRISTAVPDTSDLGDPTSKGLQ